MHALRRRGVRVVQRKAVIMSAVIFGTSTHNWIDDLFRGRNRKLAHSLIAIIDDLTDYCRLTVRQVYYQCVARQ